MCKILGLSLFGKSPLFSLFCFWLLMTLGRDFDASDKRSAYTARREEAGSF
jgi:hypothetical protein